MLLWCCSAVCESTGPGLPMKFPKKPECDSPWNGEPKPILKAHRTQTTSTIENVANVSIMLLIDQRFCITPPYRTARPGTLIRPTSVAAVICQEVSPEFSQVGASSGKWISLPSGTHGRAPSPRPSQERPACASFVAARRTRHVRESSVESGSLAIGTSRTRKHRKRRRSPARTGFRLRQPTGSPARRHSAATVRAAWAVNAPGVCEDAHVSRATAPQRLICCAPVAAGIVT